MAEAITIVVLGSISGLKNVSQIHQWATDCRVSGFLKEKFGFMEINAMGNIIGAIVSSVMIEKSKTPVCLNNYCHNHN